LHVHAEAAHVAPTEQALPHMPQLAASLVRSTHAVPQHVLPAAQSALVAHVVPQAVAPAQANPPGHAPGWAGHVP
jgi:hypothetical protein